MAITINESTQVITVAQADLTLVSGTLYELDTNDFRLVVGGLLDNERYDWMLPAFAHNGEVTVAGTTFARTIELINGYSLTFEDGAYSVRLTGSNNNFFDVENGILNQNQVQVIPGNAAGLIVTETTPVEVVSQVVEVVSETADLAELNAKLDAIYAATLAGL